MNTALPTLSFVHCFNELYVHLDPSSILIRVCILYQALNILHYSFLFLLHFLCQLLCLIITGILSRNLVIIWIISHSFVNWSEVRFRVQHFVPILAFHSNIIWRIRVAQGRKQTQTLLFCFFQAFLRIIHAFVYFSFNDFIVIFICICFFNTIYLGSILKILFYFYLFYLRFSDFISW